MKIYISGKITGLSFPEVKAKFQAVQDFLEDLDFEVVNSMNNGLTKDDTWEQHMVKDIAMLLSCEAIYMLDNWTDSVGASIEYDIAMRTGKDIWFESRIVRNQRVVLKIQNAIHEVTGMKFNEYITKSRKRDGFFARMLFVYHCRQERMKLTNIAQYVHRDHTSMLYLLKKYEDETKYNPTFRELAQKVDNILNRVKYEA
jgi:chromosomal replication initiation ATPase DnaA